MPNTAFQRQYRQEFIAGFEDRQSVLRATTVQEAVIKGNEATFLVADSGSATAVNRGVNGLIPARGDNLTQNTATLQEWHRIIVRIWNLITGKQFANLTEGFSPATA